MTGRRLRSRDITAIDLNSEYLGVPRRILMENAGAEVARAVAENVDDLGSKRVVVLAGSGNNGGDALVAARHLASLAKEVHVLLISRTGEPRTEEARDAWEAVRRMACTVRCHILTGDEVPTELRELISSADVIIDGVFGTGIRGEVGRPYSEVFALVNSSRATVFAVDVPSGVNPDTGEYSKRMRADFTVCLHAAKPFVDLVDAGRVLVRPIGAPPEAELIAGPGDAEVALSGLRRDVTVRMTYDGSELALGARLLLERLVADLRVVGGEGFSVDAEGGAQFSTVRGRGVLLITSGAHRDPGEALNNVRARSESAGCPVWALGGFDPFASKDHLKANWLEPEHVTELTRGAMVALAALLSASVELHYAVGASIYLTRRVLRETANPPSDIGAYLNALCDRIESSSRQNR